MRGGGAGAQAKPVPWELPLSVPAATLGRPGFRFLLVEALGGSSQSRYSPSQLPLPTPPGKIQGPLQSRWTRVWGNSWGSKTKEWSFPGTGQP